MQSYAGNLPSARRTKIPPSPIPAILGFRPLALGRQRLSLSRQWLAHTLQPQPLSPGRLLLGLQTMGLSLQPLRLGLEWLRLDLQPVRHGLQRLALDSERQPLSRLQLRPDPARLMPDPARLPLDPAALRPGLHRLALDLESQPPDLQLWEAARAREKQKVKTLQKSFNRIKRDR